MNHVARVLQMHCCGLLVIDEIQNLENAPKNKQSLMTLLVSASNELGVPIMFIGTNKARRLLGLDFRQARRSIGQGLAYWDRLDTDETGPNEWNDFLEVLWRFQWVTTPVPLTPFFSSLMFHHTQGVIDLAIKLFAAAQWRAMLDGSETITQQLMENVANHEMALVKPMIEALRKQDLKALEAYDDIAPLGFENLLKEMRTKYEGARFRAASIRPGDEQFVPKMADALMHLGVEPAQAEGVAQQVQASGTAHNVLDGMSQAVAIMAPIKQVKAKKGVSPQPEPELSPGDLRLAIRAAQSQGTTILKQLEDMHMLCDLEQTLDLS